MLDLPYEEDARADTDKNVVMTGRVASSKFRARRSRPHSQRDELDELLDLAR